MSRLLASIVAIACAVGLGAAPPAAAAPAAVDEEPLALSDEAKRNLMLTVIERFVPHAESFHRPSDLAEPATDYYVADGPGVTQPRGAGNIALAYATLLTARPDQPAFGGVVRAELLDHTIQSIRHEALTSRLSGAGYDRWGRGEWQSSLETYGWGWAAHLLWGHLDTQTRDLVRRVVTGEADILIDKPIATGRPGDTGAEDNAWNAPTPALAAVMFPDHPNRARWEESAIRLAVNASSTAADEQSSEPIDGRPLHEWIESVNLHPDLTMENHGYFNPIYQQVTQVNIGEAATIYAGAGHAVPEGFSFRTEEVWNRILGPVAADDGDLVMTAGQDWTSKDYQHLDYLTVLATRFRRADASVAESRALQLVARRQATHSNGSIIGQPRLGYESMLIKRLTAAWWNHQLFGPSPQPTRDEYDAERRITAGVRQYEYVGLVQARQRDAFTSMSWDSARPMGLVVPAAHGHAADPIFTAYAPGSLVGGATGTVGPYSCDCRADSFSTAGSIGARRFSMTSFGDGTVLLLDRGDGATFTIALERIAGLAPDRPIYSQGGEGIGDLRGNWVNAADRLGMVVAGGAGLRVRDVSAANPYRLIEGSTGTGSGNRGAVIYPLVDRTATAGLAGQLDQPVTPADWSALLATATDGTRRLAVARWGGPDTAALQLSDSRGAPVPPWPASVHGTTARTVANLAVPASRGEVLRWFVDADAPLTAKLDGENRAVLTNDGQAPVTATVTHVTGDGRTLSTTRELFAGERVTARLVDGTLTLAGPEYEPLRQARQILVDLIGQVDQWERDGVLDRGQAISLRARVRLVETLVDSALAEAGATAPDTGRIDTLVRAARNALGLLHSPGPPQVRERLAADRAALVELFHQIDTGALGVTVRMDAPETALPGEALPVRVTLTHRGLPAVLNGVLRVEPPPGWPVEPARTAVGVLMPGRGQAFTHQVTVPATAELGQRVPVRAVFDYRWGAQRRSATAVTEVTVRPVVTVTATHGTLPLAVGGWNRAELTLASAAARPITVGLTATPPAGVTVEPARRDVELAAGQTVTVAFDVRNAGPSAGTAQLPFLATVVDTGAEAATAVSLRYSRNLALNGVGAAWPAAVADSHQAAFGPALANDGDPATFWVSAGTAPGQGPSPTTPIALGVDFGAAVRIGGVSMTPRPSFGPTAYTVEVSTDGVTWQPVATVAAAPASGTTTVALDRPATARHLRLVITGSWDRVQPPRNVQVAELAVMP